MERATVRDEDLQAHSVSPTVPAFVPATSILEGSPEADYRKGRVYGFSPGAS